MNKKIRLDTALFMILSAIVLTALLTYTILNNLVYGVTESMSIFSKLKKAYNIVNENYIGEINSEKIIDETVRGYVNGLGDPYAQYFTKEEYREYEDEMAGKYYGIGIKVTYDEETKGLFVSYVMKGSPAEKKGIQVGDIITAVEDKSIVEIGVNEAYSVLKNEAGTLARFSILRNGETLPFEITREEFIEPSVDGKFYNGIGYIRIFSFSDNTATEFKAQVDSLISQGATSFIFDVRDNGGGGLTSLVSVLDVLLPKDTLIATLRYKPLLNAQAGDESNIKAVKTNDTEEIDLPFVILVNGETASAAELFTAALRDVRKSVIIGETTFGKGVGQETITLPDNSYLKITTFTYVPPNGVSYDKAGIIPDREIPFPNDLQKTKYVLTPKEDPQLGAAITELGGVIEEETINPDEIID